MRVGAIAEKIGMTRIYAIDNSAIPVTLLKLRNCIVLDVIDYNKEQPFVTVIVSIDDDATKVNKPQRIAAEKKGIPASRYKRKFKVKRSAAPSIGHVISAKHFIIGQYVDVSATSIGKGFAGAMKRHNFAGLEASHGVSISHRSHGSTGQRQDPGKVFKGKKMAGHMGSVKKTIQGLEIMYNSTNEDDIIAVCGGVPGSNGSLVTITDAVKHPLPNEAPYPYIQQHADQA